MPVSIRILSILGMLVFNCSVAQARAETAPSSPRPCVVQLSDTTIHYQPILTGAPQTTSMESGLVILKPGASGTQHSTKDYEEAIIVISGEGELLIAGGPTLKLAAHSVAYCPTKTVHNIRNTGTTPLKYVYVAAKVVK
jgi:quercetin dioxygenase-like cupin family protein